MSEAFSVEVEGAEFGDRRLSQRLCKIVDRLIAKPHMSIPAATHLRAEMEAAYRFFDNPKVSPSAIMEPHVAATCRRICERNVVLLVQDTTDLDLTRPSQQVCGAGPMETHSRFGAYYHPLMAFTPEGLALGTVWSKSWTRDSIETELTADEKRKQRLETPIEEKESVRWLEGMRAAREIANRCSSTQCICVADSEADIYEFFAEPRDTDQGELHLLVRAGQDRALTDHEERLFAAVRSQPVLWEATVDVSSRKAKTNVETRKRRCSRSARIAEVEVRAASVSLRPPPRHDRKLPALNFNVVLIEEAMPPEDEPPIQWLLITTLPIDELEQVQQVVHYYCVRWQIEVYFRTLKSGCRVEERYFERLVRLLNCLAVYSIVAWKVLYLCRLSRECPDLSCEVVFDESEWKSVYIAVKRKQPPETPPTINEMTRMIASLGGYVIRNSTNPGCKTLWLGLQRAHDFSTAWATFGPDS